MRDITKCRDTACNQRHTCYRYISDPYSFQQSYFIESPLKEDGSCDYYWEYKPKKKDNETQNKTEE